MLHRNVSYTNILWEPEPDGRARFVLNDFDLPVQLDGDGNTAGTATALHRAGTLAFVAMELLENMAKPVGSQTVLHQLYHDYESLFWVALWSAMKTERNISDAMDKEIRAVVSRWETGDYETIAHRKNSLSTTNELQELPFTPSFKPLGWFLSDLFDTIVTAWQVMKQEGRAAFWDVRAARSAEEVKHEWISRDKIQEVVNAHRRVPT